MHLILFGTTLICYFSLHSFLAHQKVKAFIIQRWMAKRYYRLAYNLVAIILLLLIFFYYQSIERSLLFDISWLETVGVCVALSGIVFGLFALRQYNLAEFSGTQQYRNESSPAPEQLNTSGLNAYVRHPLYFAMLLFLWGCFLYQPTDLFLVVAGISSAYIYVGTLLEEEKLVMEFGEEYLAYQRKVGMLLPFISF